MTTPRTTEIESLPQGDVALLESAVAQRLLSSTELARLGYTARDGTPRVLPMLFHWNGAEVVMSTFAGAHKIAALRERPSVAITIDTATAPPEILLIRGRAEVTDVDGVVEEYALAHRRYYGEEQAAATLAEVDRPGTRMARIAVRPDWVGVLDFQTRVPGVLAGAS
ncbi:pyridoxamine 5'-phosphate oxidase family protein [Prauserella flavalba]|uniref:Pyridoxamine 5'-phosphate oxidase n=1 Tax=Prauserella flavalba TaxID=1477506 RepID=A0A318LBV5_9PSEU|nr:pyridoxamine 5'-phosphate oxidase family protein [Prauserella flavalba]PXY20115.1 pyridoxamine 5'-phosphate oxidase [Prauserella flavalba]